MKYISKIVPGLIVLLYFPVQAQNNKELEGEEITVEASFKPEIPKVMKIRVQPEFPKEEMKKPDFQYQLEPVTMNSEVVLKPIVAARVKKESNRKHFPGNYLKAGLGTYLNPLIEFSAASKQSKEWALGLFLKHKSMWGKMDNYAYPGYNNNAANVYIKRFFDRNAIEFKPYYTRNDFHYYGIWDADTTIAKEFTPASSISMMGGDIRFYSHIKDDDMLYKDIRLHYNFLSSFSDFYEDDIQEHSIVLNAHLYKNVLWFKNTDIQRIGGRIVTDFVQRYSSLMGLVKIMPRYEFGMGIYNFQAGFNLDVAKRAYTKMDFFPFIRLEVNVLPDYLKIYLKIDGDEEHLSYQNILSQNFFSANVPSFFETDKTSDLMVTKSRFIKEAGIKGSIAKSLDFDLSFMNANVEDMLFFSPQYLKWGSETQNYLNVAYTPVFDTVNYSRLALDMNYHQSGKMDVLFHFQYDNYSTSHLDFAILKPDFSSYLSLYYTINEQIKVKSTVLYMNARKYYSFSTENTGNLIETTPVIDINIGGEYTINKQFSAFLELNNLLNRYNYLLACYPAMRFNAMAGVKFRF